MGINKINKTKMRVIIAIVALIAMSSVMTQAMVPTKKWLCCKNATMYEPRWDVSCAGSARRLQGMVEQYCPAKLTKALEECKLLSTQLPQTALTSMPEEDYK